MEKEILRMLEECKMRYHLKALMPARPFRVAFDNGLEVKMISLGKNELSMVEEESGQSDFTVEGSPELMNVLISGKEKLSILSERREVEITGSYRGLLFVESVLTLCRLYDSDPVVI
ncbi:hypothetical protein V1502_17530 [Bacillus sp. SCS-153A]|uniref:hypothetical protein n=1 Tax=Rossellomorea sedimentorum TaxID=3115294 RepID=UPI003905C9F6